MSTDKHANIHKRENIDKHAGIDRLAAMIGAGSNIVFFGGAGVSTESNIPDFRSDTGLYGNDGSCSHPPEVMLSHSFFMNNPDEFYRYYKSKMIYKEAKPNPAHIALAELERRGNLKAVVTQNIDGLHQMAGSKNVIELHGSVYRNYCMKCKKKFGLEYVTGSRDNVPKCDACGGIVRPDVVLYEEMLDYDAIGKAAYCISNADILIVGGTSLVVYPAAGLIENYRGTGLVLINKSSTPFDRKADLVINDSIGMVLDSAVKRLATD